MLLRVYLWLQLSSNKVKGWRWHFARSTAPD